MNISWKEKGVESWKHLDFGFQNSHQSLGIICKHEDISVVHISSYTRLECRHYFSNVSAVHCSGCSCRVCDICTVWNPKWGREFPNSSVILIYVMYITSKLLPSHFLKRKNVFSSTWVTKIYYFCKCEYKYLLPSDLMVLSFLGHLSCTYLFWVTLWDDYYCMNT